MYHAIPGILEGFSMQKARGAGPVQILYAAFAFNESSGAAEGYMEFHDQIWSNNLIDRFEELGATSVDVTTFQNNDGHLSAVSAFHRVMETSASPGFKLISAGEINPKVAAKARQLQAGETRRQCPNCGVNLTPSTKRKQDHYDELDVVKNKRNIQDICDISVDFEDSDDNALNSLGDFSEAVLSALEDVSLNDSEIMKEEMAWLHTNGMSCASKKVQFGYVYAAWNPCFEELVKIGATMKDNPFERIKQLSGTNVPKSFELIACVPSKDPFALEKQVHSHFKAMRIRKDGRTTEFFKMDRETVSAYLNSLVLLF